MCSLPALVFCRCIHFFEIADADAPARKVRAKKFSENMREFQYVWNFLRSQKKWKVQYGTGTDPNTYYVSEGLLASIADSKKERREISKKNKSLSPDKHEKLPRKRTFAKDGKEGQDFFVEKEHGVEMVCGDGSSMKNDYRRYWNTLSW